MSFLSNILPQSFFGVPMPWAHHETPPQAPSTQDPSQINKEQPAVDTTLPDVATEKETTSSTEQVTPTHGPTPSIEIGLKLLAAEQSLRLQKKAAVLHEQIRAKHQTIKQIDDLMALLASRAQTLPDGTPNPDGSIDCQEPAVRSLVDRLRKEGINVPLPNGVLSQAERNNAVNALVNQRGVISDEQREKGQEFHQCVAEQNSFYQMLMSLASTLHQMYLKIIGTIGKHAAS
jgi:hypothetical protein